MYPFEPNARYKRAEIKRLVGLPESRMKGGDWDTGYARHGNDHFVFVNVGTAGRTGHDYQNAWIGNGLLRWFGKSRTRQRHPSIQALVGGAGVVYLFWRSSDTAPFTFAGVGDVVEVRDTVPVEVIWAVRAPGEPALYPDELPTSSKHLEGARRTVTVNRYERDPEARRKCIDHWGARCLVCDVDFGERYGEFGEGFIHVHHCHPLGDSVGEYEVDPIEDLRPVCPNCHAMLHRHAPLLRVEELRERLLERHATAV